MRQIVFLELFIVFCLVRSQTINNVRVIGHIEYILKVLQDTVKTVEDREWCNLKLLDIVTPVNEKVIDRHYVGTVTYTNGFVVSIQQVDILQSSVQQIWSWNDTIQAGTVSMQGTLRMTQLALGYDVIADFEDGSHRYTAIYSHPLISFNFKMFYSIENEKVDSVVVDATIPRVTTLIPNIFPKDATSDVLTTLFNPVDTEVGIQAWCPDVFQPITINVTSHTEFPRICYDCPVT